MPKRRSRFILPLVGLTLLLVIGVGLYVAAAEALNPAKLTAELQRSVKRATGRDLTVTGSVHLALGLAPSFVVEGVSLANVPGGSRPQMLTAKSLRADVALLPLLTGDAVVESLTIEDPDILLERAPDGTPNWQFTPVRRAAIYQGQPGEPSGGGGGSHVEIHTLHVKGGQLTWQPANGNKLVLCIDTLTASNENPAAPLRIELKAEHDGTPLTVEATSGALDRLQGGPVSAMAGPWPLTLQVNSGEAVAKLDGGIAHPDQMRGYLFTLTGNFPDLAVVAPFFPGVSIPPLKDVTLSARLSDSTAGDLRTSQLSVHAGAADLTSWATGLSIKSASLSAPGPGQNAQLNVDGFYADAPLHLAGTAMQPDVLAQNAPIPVTLSGEAGNAQFSAKGSIPPALNASGLDLIVSARAPDLAELSALVGRTLPPAHDLQFDAHVEDAGFKLRGVTLRDLSLSSSVAQISGTTTVLWSPRPGLKGTLVASHLDLDALFPDFSFANAIWAPPSPATSPESTPPAATSAQAPAAAPLVPPTPPADPSAAQPVPTVISDRPLNFALFRNADADLTLTAGTVIAGGEHYRDVSGHLTLADGKAALNPFRVSVKTGVLVGGASIDANADQPPVAISLRASAFPASLIASLAGIPNGASGALQLDLQLSGAGQTPRILAASLDGHAGLSMVNGMLDGELIQTLIGDSLNAAGVPSIGTGNASVRCLALRAEFSHGIADMRALAADTSRLSLDGSGEIDLAAETFDLHLKPSLHTGAIAATAPVSLTGPFAAPKAALDPVMGGRVGFSLNTNPDDAAPSACDAKLSIARGGAPGPMPTQVTQAPSQNFNFKKPKDLLQGLFH